MKTTKKKAVKPLDPSEIQWVLGAWFWPKKGGFFKRMLQPAVVECLDGSKVTLNVTPVKDLNAAIETLKSYAAVYDNLSPERKAGDAVPMERKPDLPMRFQSQPDYYSRSRSAPVDITVTPWEAKLLGDRLLAFARAEKAVPPCETCGTVGAVHPLGGQRMKCVPCKGTGWLKPPKAGK